jgi:hypothetical protein
VRLILNDAAALPHNCWMRRSVKLEPTWWCKICQRCAVTATIGAAPAESAGNAQNTRKDRSPVNRISAIRRVDWLSLLKYQWHWDRAAALLDRIFEVFKRLNPKTNTQAQDRSSFVSLPSCVVHHGGKIYNIHAGAKGFFTSMIPRLPGRRL